MGSFFYIFERRKKMNQNLMQKLLYKSAACLKRNSGTILTIMSTVGVVTTTVLAVKATPRAVELIKKDSRINHDGDHMPIPIWKP